MVGLFWEAARPKTLGAGVVCVLVGTAAAGSFIAWRFAAAMVASVAVQVAVNYANDYFDAVKGVDTVHRTGPRRVTSAGLVTPGQMRLATGVALGVASVPGLALAAALGPQVIVVGLFCFAAALGCSGGPKTFAWLWGHCDWSAAGRTARVSSRPSSGPLGCNLSSGSCCHWVCGGRGPEDVRHSPAPALPRGHPALGDPCVRSRRLGRVLPLPGVR